MSRFLIASLFFVAAEASMRGHSMAWYTMGDMMTQERKKEEPETSGNEQKAEDAMKGDHIPVFGGDKAAEVKAFKYRSKPVVAPDQGFEGGDVAHAHMKTTTADWGTEYGPEAWWLHKPKASAQSISIVSGMVLLMAQFLFTA